MSKPWLRQARRVYLRISKDTNELLTDCADFPRKAEEVLASTCNTSPRRSRPTLKSPGESSDSQEEDFKHSCSPFSMTARVSTKPAKTVSQKTPKFIVKHSEFKISSKQGAKTDRSASPLYSRRFYKLSTHFSLNKASLSLKRL
jgi:hypothetical protein